MSRYAPRARRIEELTDDELAMFGEARVSAEYDHLNALLDDWGEASCERAGVAPPNLVVTGEWPYIIARKVPMSQLSSQPARGRLRAERLEARVTSEQKSLIERAAALQGRSVTDFVIASVQDAARRAIEDHQRLDLSLRDSQVFVEAFLDPQPVNDRLRETVRLYRDVTGV